MMREHAEIRAAMGCCRYVGFRFVFLLFLVASLLGGGKLLLPSPIPSLSAFRSQSTILFSFLFVLVRVRLHADKVTRLRLDPDGKKHCFPYEKERKKKGFFVIRSRRKNQSENEEASFPWLRGRRQIRKTDVSNTK